MSSNRSRAITSTVTGAAFSRRSLLQGAAAGAAALVLGGGVASTPAFAAATRPFIPSNLTYAPGDPLAGFFQKVAAGTATVIFNGDSITEAYGADNPQEGYPARVLDRLRFAAKQPVGGLGYIPSRYQFSSMNPKPITATYLTYYGPNDNIIDIQANAYVLKRSTQQGLGRRSLLLEKTAIKALSFRQTFTSFRLSWRAASAAATKFSVQIGSAPATWVTSASTAESTWQSPKFTSGEQPVTVTAETGGVFIEGVELFDGDETAGFQALESSQSGSMTWQFSSASVVNGQPGSDGWANSLKRYNPDLITSMWGTNDYSNQVPPADMKQHTKNYLAVMEATRPTAAKLVIMPYQFGVGRAIPWATYLQAQRDAVTEFRAANPSAKVGFLDLGTYIPKYFGGAAMTPEFMSDGIHPNSRGYDVIAAILYAYFTSKPA